MCWLCRAVDHVFDSLDPYLDGETSFKRYTCKRKLHGNPNKIFNKKIRGSSKTSKHRYIQNRNKQVALVGKNVTSNDNKNVHLNIKKEYNVCDHIYHRNKLKRASSMPIYTSRPHLVHRTTLAIEGPRVKGISRSAKELRSRSLERSLARRGLERSRSEGGDTRRLGTSSSRRHVHISRRIRRPTSRAQSYSPSRSSRRRRNHSHDEVIHRRTHKDISSSRPSSTAIKHHSVGKQESLKHAKGRKDSSRSRSYKYVDESVNFRKSRPVHKGTAAFIQSYSESSEEESEEGEEYEEEYEEKYGEENEMSYWQDIKEQLRIRRELREEYFRMMKELFIMSGDGKNSKQLMLPLSKKQYNLRHRIDHTRRVQGSEVTVEVPDILSCQSCKCGVGVHNNSGGSTWELFCWQRIIPPGAKEFYLEHSYILYCLKFIVHVLKFMRITPVPIDYTIVKYCTIRAFF